MLEKLENYNLEKLIGHGTSANVYLAYDTDLDRRVALKILEGEVENTDQLFRESRKLARLRHQNIIEFHSARVLGGKCVIDMEYVDGISLKSLLDKKKNLSLDLSFNIIAQLLQALDYAHSPPCNLIHRDIKPGNILISQGGTVKLADFGESEFVKTNAYLGGAGTYPYMAPEDFADCPSSDRRSDLWAVGVLLYQMLTGKWPFRPRELKNPFLWKSAVENEKIRPLKDYLENVPEHLQGIIDGALARDKHQRFQSAETFLNALRRFGFYVLPLSEDEFRIIDRFVTAFNRITNAIRQEVGPRYAMDFVSLVRNYSDNHPKFEHEKELRSFAAFRNKLSHEPTKPSEFRLVPLFSDVLRIEEIEQWFIDNGRFCEPTEMLPSKVEDASAKQTSTPTNRIEIANRKNQEHSEVEISRSELPTVIEQPSSPKPIPLNAPLPEKKSQTSMALMLDQDQWLEDWINTLFIADYAARSFGVLLVLPPGLRSPIAVETNNTPDAELANSKGQEFYLYGEEIRRITEDKFIQEMNNRSRLLQQSKKRLGEVESLLAERWKQTERKRLLCLEKVKRMTSGLTANCEFYESSEQYVKNQLRPTISQNVIDQFARKFAAIESDKQRLLPDLRVEYDRFETAFRTAEEGFRQLKVMMASPAIRAATARQLKSRH